jgi:hypothetical protein
MDFSARRLRFGENAGSLAAHTLLKFNFTISCWRSPRAVAQGAQLSPGDLMGCERDRRAIREKIETEPKIRKWFQDLAPAST